MKKLILFALFLILSTAALQGQGNHETEEFDGEHGFPGIAKTLDFHLHAFANPLPKPATFSHADAYPNQLSGGQKQRVAIARALAMEPRGLLCDEITSALDPELKSEVLDVLVDLKREGLTLLLVTHEIGFARKAADRVVVLADGGIAEEGTPEQVIDRPRTERTKQFLSRVLTQQHRPLHFNGHFAHLSVSPSAPPLFFSSAVTPAWS